MNDKQNTSELTPDQRSKLTHCQEITGITDTTKCRQALDHFHWNMHRAVDALLTNPDGQFPPPPKTTLPKSSSSSSSSPSSSPNEGEEEEELPPMLDVSTESNLPNRPAAGLADWTWNILALPIRFLWSTIFDLVSFVLSFFRTPPQLTPADSDRQVTSFLNQFDSRFGRPVQLAPTESHPSTSRIIRPDFIGQRFQSALNRCRQELRFLIVYLHDWRCPACEKFCREVVCNETVVATLAVGRPLFWACDVGRMEGYRLARSLRVRNYPFVGVFGLRQSTVALVGRLECFVDGQQLVGWFSQIERDHQGEFDFELNRRQRQLEDRTIRQVASAAYHDTLVADQRRERQLQEDLDKKRRLEEDLERQLKSAQQLRQQIRQQLGVDGVLRPVDGMVVTAAAAAAAAGRPSDNSVRIVFKLPSGDRIQHFFAVNQTLQDVYNFIYCHNDVPKTFSLIRTFPRGVRLPVNEPRLTTPAADQQPSIQAYGLQDRELLLVETVQSDDDDDDDDNDHIVDDDRVDG